jgi:hypothetical protein
MTFQLLPILDTMLDFYQKPLNPARFQAYLQLLQGDTKGDLVLPIGGFNPMAKSHIVLKIKELQAIQAEKIIVETLASVNQKWQQKGKKQTFQVALNIADDLHGGWTNRFTTDYDAKFKINALVNRNFCTPFFWSSENYDENLICERTLEAVFNTIYWLENPKSLTLKNHIDQLAFVSQNIDNQTITSTIDFEKLNDFYQKNLDSDDYHLIFNFLYGDAASQQLAFPSYGIEQAMSGFLFAKLSIKKWSL